MGAGPASAQWRTAGGDRKASICDRQPGSDGGCRGLVSCGERQAIGPTRVPTLFSWGDADDTVGRMAAEGTAEFIAADYSFAELSGASNAANEQHHRGSGEHYQRCGGSSGQEAGGPIVRAT